MHPLLRALAVGSVFAASLCACPGEDPAPTCGNLDTKLLPSTAAVTFSKDIAGPNGLFNRSCQFQTCHGSSTAPNGLFLADTDLSRLHASIVGVPSQHLPSMPFVTPGDPEKSFLMRKLDNTHCQLNAQCVKSDCGLSMPYNDTPLDAETRSVVRRWIVEGAKND